MKMQIISLFGGIEGFGLAGDKIGWDLVLSCEIAEFPSLVTKRNFPNTFHHSDIHTLNYETIVKNSRWNPSDATIVVGGFPCQPYSLAGKRQGKDDDRHLWPEMLRVIREVQPTWVVGENVPGLVNWSGGVVFEEVQSDLEAEGYEVQSFILPAAGVGAPHRRDRVWIVAYSDKCTTGPSRTSAGTIGERSGNNDEPKERGKQTEQHFGQGNVYGTDSDTRLQRQTERQQQTMGSEQLCKKRIIAYSDHPRASVKMRNNGRGEKDDQRWERFSRPEYRQNGSDGVTSDTPSQQSKRMQSEQREFSQQRQREFRGDSSPMGGGNATDTGRSRQQKQNISTEPTEQEFNSRGNNAPGADWQNFPTQSPICDGDDGISADLVRYILRTGGDCYTEEEAEKEAKRIISKVRAEGIKAGGNAIVHQVALQIFKSINEFEKSL